MAEHSRVEDLRQRYHENPRRFFAPLANEYRKAGLLDRALLLCQKHVPEQPDNMNGLVVYGQILFESGNTDEAREPFERALTVDPENLIALRYLGDIARLGGDVATAQRWYERVLELDHRNNQVRNLLELMGVGDVPVAASQPIQAARPSKRTSLLDVDFYFAQTGDAAEPPVAPAERPKPRMTKADMSSLPLLADFGLDDDEPTPSAPTPSAPTPSLARVAEPPPRPSKPTLSFVTETMAALYVQQGHIGDAIAVYRQLVEHAPSDAGMRAKLGELERTQQAEWQSAAAFAGAEMPEFDEPLNAAEPEPAAANAAMDDVSFGDIGLQGQGTPLLVLTPAVPLGPSAREFFGGFARRAPAVVASTASWPLDTLFGAAHNVRDRHAAEVLAGVATFNGPDGGSGLDALFAVEPQSPSPTAAAEPGEDNLDQFHGWPRGLE
jgi:tetratricopeptide (TPR) repeat protein